MSERKGGMVLLGIIAFAALGFSGYMFIDNQFLSIDPPDNGLILVGLWDDLAKNKENAPYNTDASWLLEFYNNQYNDSNYISVDNDNTRFKLLKEGFYKITLLLYLYYLDPPSATYWVYLYRNNSVDHCLAKIALPTSEHYQVESSLYIKSTGLDNFFIRTYCTGDTSFGVATSQSFNQLSFEYNQ
ncbi:MAG: hypothetical protein ACTSV5_06555 [Promethearchaeota archaeon]